MNQTPFTVFYITFLNQNMKQVGFSQRFALATELMFAVPPVPIDLIAFISCHGSAIVGGTANHSDHPGLISKVHTSHIGGRMTVYFEIPVRASLEKTGRRQFAACSSATHCRLLPLMLCFRTDKMFSTRRRYLEVWLYRYVLHSWLTLLRQHSDCSKRERGKSVIQQMITKNEKKHDSANCFHWPDTVGFSASLRFSMLASLVRSILTKYLMIEQVGSFLFYRHCLAAL